MVDFVVEGSSESNDIEVPRHPLSNCVVCGRSGSAEVILPPIPALDSRPPWRCHTCFAKVLPNFLHCSSCGGTSGNSNAVECRLAYSQAGIICACQRIDAHVEQEGMEDVKHVILAYGCFLLPVLASLPFSMREEEIPTSTINVISCVLYGIGMLFVAWNWRLILPLLRFPSRGRLRFFLIPFLAAPVTVTMAYLQLVAFPSLAQHWVNYSEGYLRDGYTWGAVFFCVAVCPAFFEELMFRGVILYRLRRVMTPWQSIIVTAVIFGFLHLTAIGVVFYLVPLALVAGWLTFRTESLIPAMLMHLLHNGTIVGLEWMGY